MIPKVLHECNPLELLAVLVYGEDVETDIKKEEAITNDDCDRA